MLSWGKCRVSFSSAPGATRRPIWWDWIGLWQTSMKKLQHSSHIKAFIFNTADIAFSLIQIQEIRGGMASPHQALPFWSLPASSVTSAFYLRVQDVCLSSCHFVHIPASREGERSKRKICFYLIGHSLVAWHSLLHRSLGNVVFISGRLTCAWGGDCTPAWEVLHYALLFTNPALSPARRAEGQHLASLSHWLSAVCSSRVLTFQILFHKS